MSVYYAKYIPSESGASVLRSVVKYLRIKVHAPIVFMLAINRNHVVDLRLIHFLYIPLLYPQIQIL